jgi:outer membrane protein TolC
MINRSLSIALLFIFILVETMLGQELLNLNDAISLALKNNQTIQVAKNLASINENNAHMGNAGLLPRLDLSSGVNYADNDRKSASGAPSTTSTTTNANLQASYTLFNGFKNIYTYKSLKTSAQISKLETRNNIENQILQVISSYYAVARASENLNIARDLVAVSGERLERARNRSNFGQANTIDVLSAQVDLNADSVTFINTKLNYDEAKRNLNVLLNREINFNFVIDSDVVFGEKTDLESLNQNALANNAAYLISVNDLKQSKLNLKIAQATNYPNLNFQTAYGYNQTASNFDVLLDNPDRSFSAGVSLSLNLFNGFQHKIQKQNARIFINNQQLLEKQARLNLEREVINSFEAYTNSRYVLRVEQNNLEAAELNFKRTQDLYNLGQVTTTQFREAQLNLIRAKYNISDAKFQAKFFEFELLKLGGNLVQLEE